MLILSARLQCPHSGMKMMLKQFTITALAALLMLGGCSDSKKKSQNANEAETLIAKTVYTLNDINGSVYEVTKSGTDFRLSGASEPVIVFDIFATWCPPCAAPEQPAEKNGR